MLVKDKCRSGEKWGCLYWLVDNCTDCTDETLQNGKCFTDSSLTFILRDIENEKRG
jgi:hypothetical protein